MGQEELSKVLSDIHVCQRCISMLCGHEISDFTVDKDNVSKITSYCCMCLGILEDHIICNAANKVCEKLTDYISTSFHLQISLPRCIKMRRHSVITFLARQRLTILGVPDINQVIGKFFEELTGKSLDTESNVLVHVTFRYSHDNEELKGQKGKNELVNCPPLMIHKAVKPYVYVKDKLKKTIGILGRYKKQGEISPSNEIVSLSELVKDGLKDLTDVSDFDFRLFCEDVDDVLMSDTGRPFCILFQSSEITTLTNDELKNLEHKINSGTDLISFHDLTVAGLSDIRSLNYDIKNGYQKVVVKARLQCSEPISDNCIRLLNSKKNIEFSKEHPDAKSEKIDYLTLKRTDDAEVFELEFKARATKFIKRFIDGRTTPTVRSLLNLPIVLVAVEILSIDLVIREMVNCKRSKTSHSEGTSVVSEAQVASQQTPKSFKNYLQEYCHRMGKSFPTYVTKKVASTQYFQSTVMVAGNEYGGEPVMSKRGAQKSAAKAALKALNMV